MKIFGVERERWRMYLSRIDIIIIFHIKTVQLDSMMNIKRT